MVAFKLENQLESLGKAAHHEQDCGPVSSQKWIGPGLYQSQAGGKRVNLLKVLQSSYCKNNCHYCEFRSSHDTKRTKIPPDTLAKHFLDLSRRKLVEGLFLSSAIHGPADRTMSKMIDTVTLIRRGGFRGYVHLKILPGASDGAIEAATRLADRVSVNLEAPSGYRLARLAEKKDYENQLMTPLRKAARQAQRRSSRVRSGVVTQFVIGGAGESDAEILDRSGSLYTDKVVKRCYYSAFSPPAEGPLASVAEAPKIRTVRLYQADWLLRFYGFEAQEIPFDPSGSLDPEVDPKTSWAELHPEKFPIEINDAHPRELLRIPGIGPNSVRLILKARRIRQISTPEHLRELGIRKKTALPYLTLGGRKFSGIQLNLPFLADA